MSGSMVDATSSRTTSPKRRRRSSSSTARSRSSASSETVKSRVARDPEEVVAQDLHPGEQLPEVAGDHRLERHEHVVADRHEARQHLLRHLHARERLQARHRVAERTRRSTATGSRCTGTAARARRPAESAPGRSAPRTACRCVSSSSLGAVGDLGHTDALLGERRAHRRPPRRARVPARELRIARVEALERLAGREAVGPARVDAGVHLVVETGHAHHEELVEVVARRSRGTSRARGAACARPRPAPARAR